MELVKFTEINTLTKREEVNKTQEILSNLYYLRQSIINDLYYQYYRKITQSKRGEYF